MSLDLEALEQSFDLIAPRGEELVDEFYARLFVAAPALRPLFPADLKRQKSMLLATLVLLRKSLRDLDAIVPKLRELGARHVGYGAEPAHYPLVGAALISSMATIAGRTGRSPTNGPGAQRSRSLPRQCSKAQRRPRSRRRPEMRATIWGCRGSIATPGPDTQAYGGNTSCVELELNDGTTVILDAGTGIRPLGLELARRPQAPIHLLLSHMHLDHLEGLPFFAPLWTPGAEVHIWAPECARGSVGEHIARYMSPPLFPVELEDAAARVVLHELPEGEWTLGSARVLADPVTHKGPTVGYRFEEGDRSLAYIPDHESYLACGYRVAKDASVLIHDAQYFESEYTARSGWGHSSVAHAVSFACTANVERLVLFHHDPTHTDTDLATLESRSRELWDGAGPPPLLAREGMCLTLGAEPVELAA
jgi:phosphoribosyl 1,2-cyclic phosphodiesterase/hemoglobin-like flavoprotein